MTLTSRESLLIDTTTWYAVANRSSRATRDRLARRTELQAIRKTNCRHSFWLYGTKIELGARAFDARIDCCVCFDFVQNAPARNSVGPYADRKVFWLRRGFAKHVLWSGALLQDISFRYGCTHQVATNKRSQLFRDELVADTLNLW